MTGVVTRGRQARRRRSRRRLAEAPEGDEPGQRRDLTGAAQFPMWGYEFVRTTVNPDGTFVLENLKAGPWFGPWFFVYEELTGPPTIVGPVTITSKDRTLTVDIGRDRRRRDRGARCRTCRPPWRARSGSSPSTPRS